MSKPRWSIDQKKYQVTAGEPVVLYTSNTASFTIPLSNRCDNDHWTSQKLKAG
ncbi:hypothetical protein GNN46_15570 [Salmonella enterica]|nr:hypothetical protein [Salmonella enterica]EGA8138472.1 hypothetical protein [Salmonella enterica]